MRFFLDANVWIAAVLSRHGGSATLIPGIRYIDGKILISSRVITEVIRNLAKKAEYHDIEYFLEIYSTYQPEFISENRYYLRKAIKIINEKDAPVLAAALTSKADYFVTLDKRHFFHAKVMNASKPMKILLPGDCVKIVRGIRRSKLNKSLNKLKNRYHDDLQKLADL